MTTKPPTTQPLTTRATTKSPTTQPPTSRVTIYQTTSTNTLPRCSYVVYYYHPAENETQRIIVLNYNMPGYTNNPSKRQIQHCPADVHKICGSDNSMCLNLKLFNQVVAN